MAKTNSQLPTPNSHNSKPKVAIVHDWLYGGGAEKVVEQLHALFPEAPIYTSYCTDEWRERLDGKVVTGYLQNWPFSSLRKYLPLLRQWWFAGLDVSAYDLIISSTGNGEAKFVRAKPGAKHFCYCHTPTHFYWRKYNSYVHNPGFGSFNWLARIGLKLLVKPLRSRDYSAAQQVDAFIANSSHIQTDIKRYYGRDSVIIHPPVNVEAFRNVSRNVNSSSPFVIWGRHVPDKRIDIAIKACNKLKAPLVIAGSGVETSRLKELAGSTISFIGRVSEHELVELASKAKAFIFTSEEDFGISPVEAMAAGVPVIAYKAGGALDYVIDGETGVFFEEQTAESLEKVLLNFDYKKFNEKKLKTKSTEFSSITFQGYFKNFINS